ncbi:MAG TPA: EI24 domain-containing protein [Micromonosporaceae bacterium]
MNVPRSAAPIAGTIGQFFSGIGLLLRGLHLYARSPRLVLLGILPALVSAVLFVAAFAVLAWFVTDLADLVTPFADDWPERARQAIRAVVELALLGLGGLLAVVTFTAVTLVVGDPFYEKISESVEDRYGGTPGRVDVPLWRSVRRSAADSARLVAVSALVGIPLFFAGLIPVVGQTAVPVLGASVGGWLLALELVGAPFYRRGLRLADRRRALRSVRPVALGFGVAVFVSFLIPLGAVLLMPAAVAGAALLARRSLGQPIGAQPVNR